MRRASALLLAVNICPATVTNPAASQPTSVTRYLIRGAPHIRDEFHSLRNHSYGNIISHCLLQHFLRVSCRPALFDRTVRHTYGDSMWLYKGSEHLQLSR